MWTRLDANLPSVKAALAALVDCDPAEIALNRNSTEGLSTVIFGVPMQPGDEVLVSEWDYPSALGGWQQRASREGIRVVRVRFDPLDDDDAIVSAYASALTARTRVMQLTHMLHWTGRVLPAERLCELARERGVVSLVDGAQTFAQMPVSFRTLGCDFFVTSLHKWLGAPVGNGMLIARRDRIASTWPLMAPFDRRARSHRQVRPLEPGDLQLRAAGRDRPGHRDARRSRRPGDARSLARADPLLGGTGARHSRVQAAYAGRRRAARRGQPVLDRRRRHEASSASCAKGTRCT